MKVKNMTLTALTAALCCVLSPIAIPVGAVPVSLALFAVCLTAALAGPVRAAAAVGIYIALGAIGLPVFAGYAGGVGHITGATGGFILGYLPCAVIVGLICRKADCPGWHYPLGMALGTLGCYLCGVVWFTLVTDTSILQALLVCVLPFVVFDIIKIAAASVLCGRLKRVLNRKKLI